MIKAFYTIDTSPSSGFLRLRETKKEALELKKTMKIAGYKNVQIKKRHSRSRLSDFK